ncbi:HNH endonuclease [Hymenobacter aerophilus]|uniref:HNH endonuclease n=1 Tax=Hymenobacter aerophilus TaxID=119644 RepID=UPI0008FBCF8E
MRRALDSISDGVDEFYSANKNEENNPILIDSNELIKQDFIKEEDDSYYEGKRHNLILNTYERNAKARLACIKYYGTHCQVCGFDFERVYGSIGSGYVQVHHLKPLSEIGEEYKVDPIKDLIPLCSNCHSMIHRREKPYSIEELQNIVNANREEK